MLKLQVIGNLGSDAEVRTENGRQFVHLSIAHTERRTRADGTSQETTQWVSATINGDGGKLLPFLKKGTKVFASGDAGLRQYHSEKDRCLKPGLNLYVRDIELITTNVDAVPRELYDREGVCHNVAKYYYVADIKKGELYDRQGRPYTIEKGFAQPIQQQSQENEVSNGNTQSDEVY